VPSPAAAPPAAADRVRIARLDPRSPVDAAALVALLDEYARDPTGGGVALGAEARARLPGLLASRPHYLGLLAWTGDTPVGLVNAFEGVSTFKARPLLNIHDIAVTATHRGRGIGRRLLAEAEAHARSRGCCKLTLEALEGNAVALALYRAFGFRAYTLDAAMGRATFHEKWLH
jgi:ribosomal protein S18 acetylase RimI-like enzyme